MIFREITIPKRRISCSFLGDYSFLIELLNFRYHVFDLFEVSMANADFHSIPLRLLSCKEFLSQKVQLLFGQVVNANLIYQRILVLLVGDDKLP